MALALLAKFIAILVSIMEFFSVPAPNACIGLALDFLAHFISYITEMPRTIKVGHTIKCIDSL